MRAAILHGPLDLRVEQVPDPEGDVIVEVQAATTCGTDVKMWRHGHRLLPRYPSLFGHETAGRRLDTGERVLVSDSVACGMCAPCRAGRSQICRSPTWVLGGFAQRIAAPRAALHPIPEELEYLARRSPRDGGVKPAHHRFRAAGASATRALRGYFGHAPETYSDTLRGTDRGTGRIGARAA